MQKTGVSISDSPFAYIDNSDENKLRFEDFNKFLEKNLECFQGFNLTKDEIISIRDK